MTVARQAKAGLVQGSFSAVMPLALEPRFMFDAAGAATASDAASDAQADAEAQQAHDGASESSNDAGEHGGTDSPAAAGADSGARREIMVVDTSVAGWQDLISDLAPGTETILIDGTKGGIAQLAQALEGQTGIEAIHILSHGDTGMIKLGTDTLTGDALAAYADSLSVIGQSLSEQGDILLYGCLVGEGGEGQAFVDALATLTGADIAASDDLTGASDLGGDWDLEIITGDIEATTPLSSVAMNNFAGVLAQVTFDFDSGTYGGYYTEVSSNTVDDNTIYMKSVGATGGVSDGLSSPEDKNFQGKLFSTFDDVSSVEIYLDESKTFDLSSLKIAASNEPVASEIFTISSDKGLIWTGSVEDYYISSSDRGTSIDSSMFNNAANAIGISKITITSDDGSLQVCLDNIVLNNISGSNAAPELGGTPADVTVAEDTPTAIDLSAYNVSDGEGDTITLTLAVDRGAIAGAAGTGITINNSGSGSMTLQGSAENLNTYLNDTTKITYTPASNDTTAATLTVTPYDGTTDGTADTVTINITPVNDAPTATNLTQTVPFTEDGGSVALGDIVVTDVDSGDTVTATLTVGNSEAGILTTGAFGSATSSYNAATGVWTVSGSVTDVNAALAAVAFTPSANWDQNVTITTRIRDAADTGPSDGTITLDATAVNDAPVATASGGTTAFTENGDAVVIDGSFTLSDVDSTDITGATVEITTGFQSGEDTLSFTDQNGITGSYNNGVLTLSGTATVAQYQAAIRSITFSNGSNDPGTANRTISITVNDGTDDSSTVTKTVSVTAVNDAPTLSATGGTPTFTEGGTAVDLFSGVTISTVESGQTISGMTFTVTHAEATDSITFDGTAIALSDSISGTTGDNGLSYNVSVAGGVATITITGGAMTTAQAQTVVDGMTYASSSDNPGTSNRVVTLTGITDSGSTANGGTDNVSLNVAATVTVAAVNDAPELANGGNSVDFSAGSGTGIVINKDLTVSDVDNTTLNSATVSITGGLDTGDTLDFTSDAAFGNITGTYDAGTGVLSLTSAGGTATVAQWQAALRSVTFSNGEASPATGTRTVSFAVNDGDADSTTATSSVEIVFAPVIGNLNGDSVTYTEGGGAVSIDTGTAATVIDNDNTDFNGGNLTVSITGGGNAAQDILGLSTGGTITLSGSTAGSTVSVDNVVIGTLANNIAAGNNLVINFDGNATPARVASLLAAIQYSNSNADDPTTGARTVRVTVTDASGGFTSAPADVTVNVVGVNDAPTVSATGGTPTFTEGGTAVDLFSGVTISTGESGQTISGMTFTVTNAEASDSITFDGTAISLVNGTGATATNGLTYNVSVTGGVATITITGGTLSSAQAQTVVDGMTYASSSENPGTSSRVVTLTGISDSGGTANSGSDTASTSIAATVTVSAVNDAPVNTVPGAQSAVSGEAKAITGISVADTDSATVTTTVSVPNGDGTFTTTGNATITGGGTNSIQISGSVADVNATLANLRYTAATTGAQTITVETSDGTDTDSDTVTVNVTARPAIGGFSGDSVAYTTGQKVKLDAGQNATVSDGDFQAGSFSNGGNLSVSITGGGNAAQDILTLDTTGNVTLDGTNVRVNGTVIGTLENPIGAGSTLKINFNADADLTNIQTLVRALSYENSSGTPAGGNRTISVTLSDTSGNTSTVSTVTVRVTEPVADTPPPPSPPTAPPSAPAPTVPPIMQTPGAGGDSGTPVSSALDTGSNASGLGGQSNAGGPIRTTVTGQLGSSSPIDNTGTPVSAGLSVNQAGSGSSYTISVGDDGSFVRRDNSSGSVVRWANGSFGGGLGGGLGGGGLGGGEAASGTGTPDANDGLLETPSTGQSPQGGDGETPTDEGASDGDGDQAMIDGNGGAKLANAPEDFSVQLAAFGDAVEKETMLLEDVLSTYRIPA